MKSCTWLVTLILLLNRNIKYHLYLLLFQLWGNAQHHQPITHVGNGQSRKFTECYLVLLLHVLGVM